MECAKTESLARRMVPGHPEKPGSLQTSHWITCYGLHLFGETHNVRYNLPLCIIVISHRASQLRSESKLEIVSI
jgi:hypothetical protein